MPTAKVCDPARYRALGEHGRGGRGRVTRAHDRDLGRDIAIKELISRGHVSEVRFLREALITARLEHPGIVPVYEAGRWPDGTPFYAMKLVAGRSLRALIAERTTVEDRLGLLHHVIAVADAIAYAHGRSIIHRDLKPANVIVGDFGETIVIDWGLAKDLSAAEEASVAGGPFRTQHEDGLTSTGSVFGTPAYMAPEQERGEPADQRADVFAIGAMLWELCSLRKLPPGYTGPRERMLRRARIDSDLATIIIKALEPDPARRYPDAGALSADLKAFKAGARIAARRYSLLALLAHWTRRHRALAISAAAAIALATAGITTYVRHIAAERDRVGAANNALILEHAQLLLQSDPTAAFEVLQDYDGADAIRREMLQAEARGLGVARLRATPHKAAVFLAHVGDGSLLSFGGDGNVYKSPLDGASPPRIIARVAANQYAYDYSTARRWLATSCPTTTICLFDVRAERPVSPPADLSSFVVVSLAWSPDGHLLAGLSAHGEISTWAPADHGAPVLRHRLHLDGGQGLQFVDDHTLVAWTSVGLRILHLDAAGPSATEDDVAVAKIGEVVARPDRDMLVAGTEDGELVVINTRTARVGRRRSVCKGRVNQPFISSARAAIAYACKDGDGGVWDLDRDQTDVLVHYPAGASSVAESADGRYFVAGGYDGELTIHDVKTGVSSSYRGHAARLTVLLPPVPGAPYVVTGDTRGELRVWPLPEDRVQVAIRTETAMYRAVPLWAGGPVIAVGTGATIPWYRAAGVAGEAAGHLPIHAGMAMSKTHPHVVLYGFDDELELWSFEGIPERRTLRTGRGATMSVAYLPDGTHFVVASSDGSVMEWSEDGRSPRRRAMLAEPASYLARIKDSTALVGLGVNGTLSLIDRDGATYLGTEHERINSVGVSPDARWLAIVNAQGTGHMYDLRTRQFIVFDSPRPSSQYLEFAPDNSVLAFATNSTISLRPVPGAPEAGPGPRWMWHDIDLAVQQFTFSADSAWFAGVCDHGGIWFNRRGEARWRYFSTGPTRIMFGYFVPDGSHFVATDTSGRALIIDMLNM